MPLTIEQFVATGFGWGTSSPNSQKSYRNHISRFEAFLKKRNKTAPDGTVTDQDILDYVEHLKSKYRQNTIATRIAAIKSYFKWLGKQGLTHQPVIRSQRHVKPEHKLMNNTDLKGVMTRMQGDTLNKQRDLVMFSLIACCGFKTEEVVAINTEDVDFENVKITINKEKRSFCASLTEMEAYMIAKLQNAFFWDNSVIEDGNEKEPFFLNKNHLRLGGRSLRRQLTKHMGEEHNIRDLRHSYFKNLDEIVQTECVEV